MFKKLRLRFSAILISTTLFILAFLCVLIYITTGISLNKRIKNELNEVRPKINEIISSNNQNDPSGKEDFLYKYFYITIKDDKIDKIYKANKSKFDVNEIEEFVTKDILQDKSNYGSFKNFYYEYKDNLIIFLDVAAESGAMRSSITSAFIVSGVVLGTISICSVILSKPVIQPYEDLYNKQKRFLTDASHELKTPLAILSANNDVLKTEYKDNQYLQSNAAQIERMSELINELVSLNKLQEVLDENEFTTFDLAEDLLDATIPYESILAKRNIALNVDTPSELIYKGDENSLMKLFSILMDNIYKYTLDNGQVDVKLVDEKKHVHLLFSNTAAKPVEVDLEKLFDRFYTLSASRDRKTSGYGIGLSIAKTIVDNYKGSIKAYYDDSLNKVCFDIKLPHNKQ